MVHIRKPHISPKAKALGPPIPKQPLKSEIADGYVAIKRSYDQDSVELFLNMLGNLPRYLTRINERIEILEETPQLRATRRLCYQIDNVESPKLLVPIALIEKGTLIDDFTVKDSNNNDVPTLPYNHLRGLFAVTLEILVETAIRDMPDGKVEKHRQKFDKVLRELVVAVCGPGPLDRLSESKSEQNKNIARMSEFALEAINELPISDKWKSELRQFCKQYVDYYVIVAEVSPPEAGNYLELTYSHRVPLGTYKHAPWRERFGLKASTIDIPLHPYAFLVEAYHQETDAESGQYIFDHHLERLKSQKSVDQKDLVTADLAPYVRLYYDEAKSNAHLYIRRQAVPQPPSAEQRKSSSAETSPSEAAKPEESLPGPLKSVIELREIPPGASGAAATIAFSSAAIISFFAMTHVGLDIDPNVMGAEAKQAEQIKATLNSDVPALLLALPAFVGVLIGSWLDLSRLRRASLTTYLALGGTMFLSLASALLFVFGANRKLLTEVTISAVWNMGIHTDLVWLILMAVAITHFLFLLRTVVEESRHYTERISRRVAKQSRQNIDKQRQIVYK